MKIDTFVFILCIKSRKPHISLTLLKSQKAFQCTSSLSGQIRIEVILKVGQFRAEVLKNVSNRLLFAPFRDSVLNICFGTPFCESGYANLVTKSSIGVIVKPALKTHVLKNPGYSLY